jgi:hypothetical protein
MLLFIQKKSKNMTYNCLFVITLNVTNDANDLTRKNSKLWGGPVSLHKTTPGDVATSCSLPDMAYVVSLLYVEGNLIAITLDLTLQN